MMIAVVISNLTLTFVGIHPIVIVTLLANHLQSEAFGTSAEVLALLYLLSWAMLGRGIFSSFGKPFRHTFCQEGIHVAS
ncbi:hypothetical protein LOK74_12820 [Brevibacillus humidisoli]|uniref:hypothetical protein n=1 Tax=Brevibacillus humidisoli TaxID=2895522 RepID=UPI001E413921|nr:hypothetical protein [Brevibacillus humidisoli]UFJ38966.1 hypothetical protein LOK74_12820 [Brevibacillus humidisoli]